MNSTAQITSGTRRNLPISYGIVDGIQFAYCNKTQSGSQGVSCAGQPEGEYIIKAYTAIRASRLNGKLNVQADESSEFEIF